MTKEIIKLFKNGKKVVFERDFEQQPLNIGDFVNAAKLEIAQKKYAIKTNDDPLDMKPEDGEELVNADLEFIVSFFHDQFNVEEARQGISPITMREDFERWLDMSSGLLSQAGNPQKK